MTLVMVLLTIGVVAGVSAVVAGLVSGGLDEPVSPIPARALPNRPLTGQDVADLRFVQAFRGYRMDQVDAAMDALAAEVERLRALLPEEADRAAGGEPPAVASGSAAPPITSTDLNGAGDAATDRSDTDRSDNKVVPAEPWPAGWPAGRD